MNIHIDRCPVCKGSNISNLFSVKDNLVSQEYFDIYSCSSCELRFTNPRPNDDSLSKYYESEDYISHTNESTSLVNRLYKIARRFTLRSKRKLIERHAYNKTLLDVGCGTGHFMAYCKSNNWQVTGVEPNSIARKQAEENTATTVYQDLKELGNKRFDVITLWHVLEHLPHLNQTIISLKELLAPSGVLILALPNYKAYEETIFNEEWAAYDVPRHLYHFNKKSLRWLVENNGLNIVKISPMWLDSFYISLLSNKNKFGKNKYINSFITGLLSNIYAFKSNNFSSLIYQIKNSEE